MWAPLAVFFLVIGCADSNSGQDKGAESEEVLGVVHDFFQALEARQDFRLSTLMHSQASLVRIDARGDTLKVDPIGSEDWLASIAGEGPALIERMHNPVVQHSGPLAEVWTYYDFHIGDKLSHCGHDAIQLVKEEGRWKILGVTYTIETCR
jgi:hypothetical protein